MKQKDLKSQDQFLDKNPLIEDEFFTDFVKKEREVKMDFSFDDFMEKVEENESKKLEPKKIYFINWFSSIAACGLILLGTIYFFKNSETEVPQSQIEIVQHNLDIKETENLAKEKVDYKTEIDNQLVEREKNTIVHSTKKSKPSSQIIVDEVEIEEELVVVNGENVYDTQRAQEIALDALQLFVSNLDRGSEAVGQLKSMSIEK